MKKHILLAFLLLWANLSYSQPRSQLFVGARPLGLGETFVAIADDGNAVYWNPAGLTNLKRIELNSMYANLYNIEGLQNIFLSFVYPITPRYVLGLGYFQVGFNDEELKFSRYHANVSFGARVFGNLSLGANVKFINTDASLDGRSEGKANGGGFDLGAFYYLPISKTGLLRQINFGAAAYDVGGTNVKFDGAEESEEILSQNIRFGFTLIPKEELSLKWFSLKNALLAFDFDDRFHMGTEFWLIDQLGLRAGFQKDFHTDESPTYSFGGSFKVPKLPVQMDYAYMIPPTLSATHLFSFSLASAPSPVKIMDINVDALYSSFYKTYANTPVGHVKVRNDYDQELEMNLKVSIPGLTATATQENFRLGPGESKETDFRVVFMKNILDVREIETRQAKVRIDYTIKNEGRFVEKTQKFDLYGRGAITWENAGKAAAFITKLDRMVELFAQEATKEMPYKSEIELGNIYTAAALFDAMSAIGIKYQPDPDNPFATLQKTQHVVDHIKYPAELLNSKQGDCDDLTVLYGSLLEFVGIKTALLSTYDHITLMFDTGIHERFWGLLPFGDSLVVANNRSLWIPVEVTEIGAPFSEAWHKGGQNYRGWKNRDDFKMVMVKDVEGLYISALPEEYQSRIPDVPEQNTLSRMIENDTLWVHQQRRRSVQENYLAKLERDPANTDFRNQVGIIFAQLDSINRAEAEFQMILRHDSNHVHATINLGNINCIRGDFKSAESKYLRALNQQPNLPGLHLNLAIMYQFWTDGDSSIYQPKSEYHVMRAFELLQGNEQVALDLVGLFKEEAEYGERAAPLSGIKKGLTVLKKFIKDSARKYGFEKGKEVRMTRTGPKRGPDRDRRYIFWWADLG